MQDAELFYTTEATANSYKTKLLGNWTVGLVVWLCMSVHVASDGVHTVTVLH